MKKSNLTHVSGKGLGLCLTAVATVHAGKSAE
jgi:hypothetical protein